MGVTKMEKPRHEGYVEEIDFDSVKDVKAFSPIPDGEYVSVLSEVGELNHYALKVHRII